ncbi:MAG: hypothetical protein MI810_08345 [Flavobacteriales bacterium]|nr:hypothetical protein [Flavobacteriales bacterium]
MLTANVLETINYDGENLEKLQRALMLMETTLNSEEFKAKVLEFDSFVYRRFICIKVFRTSVKFKTIMPKEHEAYTNEKLLDHLLRGRRKLGEKTYMDLRLKLGRGEGVGSTDMFTKLITTNEWAFKTKTEAHIAGHIAREYLQTLGFKHTHSRCDDKRDCYSIPYAIGNLV